MPGRQRAAGRAVGVLVAGICMASSVQPQGLDIQGKLLGEVGGNRISLFDLQTRQEDTLVAPRDIISHYGRLRKASFSPDGRRICFVLQDNVPTVNRIYVADNDGGNITHLCDFTNQSTQNVNWCTDGHIYWCELTNAIYRVNVLTKEKETYWDQPNVEGYSSVAIEDMVVSNDGHFGSARGGGEVSFFDLANRQKINYGRGGCSGWISPGGTRLAHPYTCCVPFPAGAESWLTVTAIESLTVTTPPDTSIIRPVVQFLWPPGQPEGDETYRTEWFRWAKNSDNYVVCKGRDANGPLGAIFYEISTQQWNNIAVSDFDASNLWIGPLPDPHASGPVIALVDTSCLLSATVLRDTVQVSNTGTGILDAVTITEDAAWLTVNHMGSGNSQSLELVASATGLADGTYRTNVAVSGGGADNAAVVVVSFNVGVYLTAPDGLAATVDGGDIQLQWNDRSDNETGFAVERADNGGAFAEIGRVDANGAVYTDSAPGAGAYEYRVRAHDAGSFSGYSNVAEASIAAAQAITLTAPAGGEVLGAGATVHVTWTASNITGVVISFSADDGETWATIHASGAIFNTDSNWGDFEWVVPQVNSAAARIQIVDYNHGPATDESGLFTVTVSSTHAGLVHGTAGPATRIVRRQGELHVSLATARSGPVRVTLALLDGAVVDSRKVTGRDGVCTLRDSRAPGMRVLRVSDGGGARTFLLSVHGR